MLLWIPTIKTFRDVAKNIGIFLILVMQYNDFFPKLAIIHD